MQLQATTAKAYGRTAMSDAMDPRHADPQRYERENARPGRPSPMHPAYEERLRIIIGHGVITPPSTVDVSAIKQVIQEIAYRVSHGKLAPCPSCHRDGVPTGIEGFTDAAGSRDTRDCETCHGWTVVTATGGEPR